MRPDRSTLSIESTLQGEDVRMGIAAGAEAHIMSVLTDLYEDSELAAIREYATNAWDSHIEAGQDRPIEVTTPTALRPIFSVKDWGIGLNAEGVRRIYSQYGASTKRGTDEQVGMLGVGCKSALTYTDQFTIVAVKDGQKITVSVSRDEDGAGTMKILSDEPTTELPGVEVQVPVKRINDFAEKAQKFFRFWEPGQVLLNGGDPAGLGSDAYHLTDSITVLDDEPNDWIVMGGVPYPIDLDIYTRPTWGASRGKSVVAKVGIGAVTFTPSREGLQDTERTKKCIENIKREFSAAAKLAVQRDVDAAADRATALTAYVDAVAALPRAAHPDPDTIVYQGDNLPDMGKVRQSRTITNSGYKHSSGTYAVELAAIGSGLWITGYTNENWAKGQREKLTAYLNAKRTDLVNQTGKPLFLVKEDEPPEKDWIPDSHIIAWETVKTWQPPRDPNAPAVAKRTGIYYTMTDEFQYVRDTQADAIDGKVFWTQGRKYSDRARMHARELIAAGAGKFTLVVLPENRVAKFKRDFPKAKEARAHLAELAKKRRVGVSGLFKEAYCFGLDEYGLEFLDADKVDDPVLKYMIAVAKLAGKERAKLSLISSDTRRYDLPETDWKCAPQESVVRDRYPLLSELGYGTKHMDHYYIYINAAYAAEKG